MASPYLMQNISIPFIFLFFFFSQRKKTFHSIWRCLSSSALHGLGNICIYIKDFIILIYYGNEENEHKLLNNNENDVVQQALCDATDILIIISIKEQCLFTCNNVLKIVFMLIQCFSVFITFIANDQQDPNGRDMVGQISIVYLST